MWCQKTTVFPTTGYVGWVSNGSFGSGAGFCLHDSGTVSGNGMAGCEEHLYRLARKSVPSTMSEARILVVDPQTAARQETAKTLRSGLIDIEITVETAEGIDQALPILHEGHVDCVVTEFELPEGTGFDLVETVRERSPDTAAILYTTATEADIEVDRSEETIVEFLSKSTPGAADLLPRIVRTSVTARSQVSYPVPQEEAARLAALESYDLSAPEVTDSLSRITDLATRYLQVSAASVNVVGDHEQEFYACHGEADGWESTPREDAICSFTILSADSVMVVEDVGGDPRFSDITTLDDLGIRAYIGADLTTDDGFTIGTLCAYDDAPRSFTEDEQAFMRTLGDVAMDLIEAYRMDRQVAGPDGEVGGTR